MLTKRNVRIAVATATIIAFFLIFFSLNSIVSFFFPEDYKVRKIDFDDYRMVGPAYYLMNDLEIVEGDLKESINCSGWVFAETEEPNDDKRGYLILKGRKNSYITSELAFKWSSIQYDVPEWKKIQGIYNDYNVSFSTVSLPNDIYEIYIYVEENENAKGIADTGHGFIKNGVHVMSFTDVEMMNVPEISTISETFDNGWMGFTWNDTYVEVHGWHIKEDIASDRMTYYAVFVGDNEKTLSFKMPSVHHVALAAELGSTQYISSGYVGCVMNEKLPDVKGRIYILAECNGTWYRTGETAYDITDIQP